MLSLKMSHNVESCWIWKLIVILELSHSFQEQHNFKKMYRFEEMDL